MEPCSSYKPWHDKNTHQTYLKYAPGKCLHYYFYFMDDQLGRCYVRVPTRCPFRLQIYFNGHNLVASTLQQQGVGHNLIDNVFTSLDSFVEAQKISDQLSVESIHKKIDEFANEFCPVIKKFETRYHWTIMQAEYATDVVFMKQADLQDIYGQLTRTAIHTVKPDNIATFLGRKIHGNYKN